MGGCDVWVPVGVGVRGLELRVWGGGCWGGVWMGWLGGGGLWVWEGFGGCGGCGLVGVVGVSVGGVVGGVFVVVGVEGGVLVMVGNPAVGG